MTGRSRSSRRRGRRAGGVDALAGEPDDELELKPALGELTNQSCGTQPLSSFSVNFTWQARRVLQAVSVSQP